MTSEEELPEIRDTPEKLLSESGRISAIQTLSEQAKDLTNKAEAIEEVTVKELTKNNAILRRNNKFLMVAVGILLCLGIFNQYRTLFISGPRLESVQRTVNGPLSDANEKLDELVEFINFVKVPICNNLRARGEEIPEYCEIDP